MSEAVAPYRVTYAERVRQHLLSLADTAGVPPQLSSQAGGEVATRADGASQKEQPREPHYLVTVRLTRG